MIHFVNLKFLFDISFILIVLQIPLLKQHIHPDDLPNNFSQHLIRLDILNSSFKATYLDELQLLDCDIMIMLLVFQI